MTPSQIDKLGERLRSTIAETDLLALDAYRNSFAPASTEVLKVLRKDFQLEPTARPAKSTRAILAKLHREGTRLSTMQDIAGCRVVVPARAAQRIHVDSLMAYFPKCKLIDRLAKPSHGYRAMHLVVRLQDRWVEIQIRTELQHQWAQLCELIADRLGAEIKYGGGSKTARQWLEGLSMAVDIIERHEEDPNAGSVDRPEIQLLPGLEPMRLDRQGLKAVLETIGPFI
jgi:putative GTP pyrophosphokinase